jgi:hypothetical protein
MQYHNSADGEAHNSAQSGNRQKRSAQTQYVSKDSGNSEDQSQHIQPHGRLNADARSATQAELQQECGKSDSRYDDQRQRTEESAAACVENDQSESEQQESGGEDGPARRLGRSGRVGSGVGQESVPKLYRGGERVFNSASRLQPVFRE